MAKRDTRLERMRRNPRNVRPDELDVALREAGFTAHQEGSHKTYRHDGKKLTVPQRKPFLKSMYVKEALDLLEDDAEEEEETN